MKRNIKGNTKTLDSVFITENMRTLPMPWKNHIKVKVFPITMGHVARMALLYS